MDDAVRRATEAMGHMVITVAQLMDMHPGIRLHKTDEGWHCDEVTPNVWFAAIFLWAPKSAPHAPIEPWTFNDSYVRLNAVNGAWIWRLTDQYRWGKTIAGQLRQRLGVWPD